MTKKNIAENMTKSPPIILSFWIIKILATTLGETGGDALSMTMNLGYAFSSIILIVFFTIMVTIQIFAKSFYPILYWTVIVATTTVGTTMADYADRSLGIGYIGGSSLLFLMLITIISIWKLSCGSISVKKINSKKVESFYWITILFSNTLGTALGDFVADSSGVGYLGGALIFMSILAVTALLYFYTKLSTTFLFWAAFILTRPLGATVGDILTKPYEHGGIDLDRISSSVVIMIIMIIFIFLNSKKRIKV